MPLSEQEQRLLEEMERSLYQNDSDFVAPAAPRGRTNVTLLAVGILIAVVGIAVLVTGVIIRQPLVGILGFVVMFGGVLVAIAPPRRGQADAPESSAGSRPAPSPKQSSFMDSLEDRWDRRQEGRE